MILLLFIFFLFIHDSIYIESFHPSRYVSRKGYPMTNVLQMTKKADVYDKEWDPKLYPKLDFNEDYYKVLEVDPSADQATIKKAYLKIVLKYHPDNRRTDDEKSLGNRQMMVINAAYKVLKNPEEKAAYDSRRNQKQSTSSASGDVGSKSSTAANSASSTYETSWNPFNSGGPIETEPSESFLEIFSDIFNDLRNNKGVNLMNDLEDFLDSQVTIPIAITVIYYRTLNTNPLMSGWSWS
jgi:hypothetical protein